MKFNINKLLIWKKEAKEPQIVPFEKNKINVVTGGHNTGKTSILKIIDYCFFAKQNDIPDDINSFVFFYGINFTINDKTYTLCRKAFSEKNAKFSYTYFFFENGDIPYNIDNINNFERKETKIKNVLIQQFPNITEDFKLLPQGTKVKANSTFKLEYILLYNTISQNIIINSDNYFDFQLNNRDRDLYKQVLDSIFDYSIGLSTKDNYEKKRELYGLEKKLENLEKAKKKQDAQIAKNTEFIKKIIYRAKEFDLVDDAIDLDDINGAFNEIKLRIKQEYSELKANTKLPKDYKLLEKKADNLKTELRKLNKFQVEINDYKSLMSDEKDALKPFEYLSKKLNNVINIGEVKDFLDNLYDELITVRKAVKSTPEIKYNIIEEIEKTKEELSKVEKELKRYPKNKKFINQNEKSIFLIESKKEIEHFFNEKKNNIKTETTFSADIKFYKSKIEETKKELPENESEIKRNRLNLLNELIQSYLDIVSQSLDKYQDYKSNFNYTKKTLELRKPNNDISSNIDGISNFLFLQLSLFLGLHELFLKKEVKFIPQFIVIDYPSLPYKSNNTENSEQKILQNDERKKLRNAFELLNTFIDRINQEYKTEFQIIILEHVQEDIWTEPTNLNNFHLAKEYRNGKNLLNS